MTNDHRGARYYDPSERITGNGFDIGNYEQISTAEKQHMLKELTWFIMSEGYETTLVAAKEAHQIGARIYSATTTEYIRDV